MNRPRESERRDYDNVDVGRERGIDDTHPTPDLGDDKELVERVARAIYAVRCCDEKAADGDGWPELPSHIQELWFIYARAALEALHAELSIPQPKRLG